MLVAKEKIKTNIGEYFLYMFQIEDLLRACKFDKNIIESNLVSQYQTDEETKAEIKEWYFGLSELMQEEKQETKGHLSSISHKMTEVFDFHLYLMQHADYIEYQNKFKEIAPIIAELRTKQTEPDLNDVNIIINTIYAVYLLKLKKQELTKETLQSASMLSKVLADLSKLFSEYEAGVLKIE